MLNFKQFLQESDYEEKPYYFWRDVIELKLKHMFKGGIGGTSNRYVLSTDMRPLKPGRGPRDNDSDIRYVTVSTAVFPFEEIVRIMTKEYIPLKKEAKNRVFFLYNDDYGYNHEISVFKPVEPGGITMIMF